MRRPLFFILAGIALCLPAFAQAPTAKAKPGAAKAWTAPRTPDGHPDLQGIWSNATITPLERPAEFAGKATLTEKEAEEFTQQNLQQNNFDRRDGGAAADVNRAYNAFWYDRGTQTVKTQRSSLVIDPPDGRVPALTPEAQKRQAARAERRRLHPADGPEDRSLSERCLNWATAGPPMVPSFYNNNYQIVQTPGYVMIVVEMIHDARIIPLDGRAHLPQNVRQWLGDPRGHWDGNTLVVETTNFTDKTRFRGAGPNMKLTERFTRVSPETILYEFTVDDPESFTRPWTAQIPMVKSEGPIFEYACHEGNYAMTGMLAGARADEEAAKKNSK